MSLFLYRLGHWSFRARKVVVALWITVLLATLAGSSLFGRPSVEGFSIPGTEAQEAMDALERAVPEMAGASAQVVVVAPDGARVDDERLLPAIEGAVADLRAVAGVATVLDPFGDGASPGVTNDGRAVLLTAQLDEASEDVASTTTSGVVAVRDQLAEALPEGSQISVGGEAFEGVEVPHDNLGELLGLALAFMVLLATFGSFVAAGMPLLSALVVVGTTLMGIGAVTAFADVSSTAPVLATMLGLAVGIDYSLFVLSRHMRQLREGMDAKESAARSVATAGSAVVFAGLTVVIALVGLAIVDIPFLTVMGVAGAAAVSLAVVVSLTLMPALLGFWSGTLSRGIARREAKRLARLGKKADGSTQRHAPEAPASGSTRFYARWSRLATSRPIVVIVSIIGAVGLLTVPSLDLRLGLGDAGSQPAESPARQHHDLVAEHFGPGQNGPLLVTGAIDGVADPMAFIGEVANELLTIEGVAAVPLATPDSTGTTAIVSVIPDSAPASEETKELVEVIRAFADDLESREGIALSVTGQTAAGIDVSTLLRDAMLPYIAFIVILSLLLLTMVFRSIWIPVKATVGFLLTIGSALGAVALVYSWGWFSGPLGVDQSGPVISFMPIIVLGVLFGLAMDYEVFLVSAMREEYVHGASARSAISRGFGRSAPIVTAAALIMFSVFATFVPAADSTIKPIALALAVGVFVDAFIVRMTFVPAVMTLLGDRAWHMPPWLDRFLPSFDVEGEKLNCRLSEGAKRIEGPVLTAAASAAADR